MVLYLRPDAKPVVLMECACDTRAAQWSVFINVKLISVEGASTAEKRFRY